VNKREIVRQRRGNIWNLLLCLVQAPHRNFTKTEKLWIMEYGDKKIHPILVFVEDSRRFHISDITETTMAHGWEEVRLETVARLGSMVSEE